MKIGIMGGTFDPIHNGHLMLGEYAYKQFALDKIWYMPNGNPPHKSDETIESQTNHRVEMVRRAIAEKAYFDLQLYEVENKEINYSYKTMERFRKVYPEHEFYFIIGADSLFSIERWGRPDLLLKECVILAAFRDDKTPDEMVDKIQYLKEKYDSDVRFLIMPNVDISSTEIREKIKVGKSIRELVPEVVADYIEEQELYKDE